MLWRLSFVETDILSSLFLFLSLLFSHPILIFNISLITILFRLIVLNLNSVLHLLGSDITQLLSFYNVAKISSISIRLQFIQQMKFMLLKLFNSCVQTTNRGKHLIVLDLELLDFRFSIYDFCVQARDLSKVIFILLLLIVQIVFNVTYN